MKLELRLDQLVRCVVVYFDGYMVLLPVVPKVMVRRLGYEILTRPLEEVMQSCERAALLFLRGFEIPEDLRGKVYNLSNAAKYVGPPGDWMYDYFHGGKL